MGNAILCRNAPCTQPRPVYKTVLQQIFQVAWEKPRADAAPNKPVENNNNETANKTSPEQIDVPKLQAHVKSHIKGLIDYLEGSHNKLIDTGNYLYKVVTGSFNPDIHMLGLLVIIELLDASSKFTHDKAFLAKLHQRSGNEDFIKSEGSTKGENKMQKKNSKDLENSSFLEYGQSLRGNVQQFEDNVVEILSFLLDGRRNPFRKSSYKHVLKALDLYTQNHLGTMTTDKMEAILNDAMEMMDNYQNTNDKESLEIQCQFMELLINLTKTSNIVFRFKQKFINHVCATLKISYEQNLENNKADAEIKELKDRIIKLAFDAIGTLSQSVFDLNEFGILISPLFVFFDNTEWKNEKLQTDIFVSLLDSMAQTSFEQVEIFFVDKIVEYVDYDASGNPNPYKHNNDIGVKIRVFCLLANIFERAKKTFLSFLVIDNITLSFLNNLKFQAALGEEGKPLKEAIYNCHKRFIEKIDRSSKNISQMISSIVAQTFAAAFRDTKDDHFINSALEFFAFTLNEIVCFPGQYFVQKDCIMTLLKIRSITEYSQNTFLCVEKLLRLRCLSEEGVSPKYKHIEAKKTELLTCPPDLVYSVLSNNLSAIRDSVEDQGEHSKNDSIEFLKFILHCARIDASLIARKDNVTLMILIAFLKKITELSSKENITNINRGLLLYLVASFIKHLKNEWVIDPISSPRTTPNELQPFITLENMENQQETSSEGYQNILIALEGIDAEKGEKYNKEIAKYIESIVQHLKTLTPASTFENLNEDFDELGSHYGGNQFISLDDGDSHRIEQSMDHNNRSHMTENTPKPYSQQAQNKRPGNKQGSLVSIGQINHNSAMKISARADGVQQQDDAADESSFIDKSFENALKEAKKNKAKTNNFAKILNNQI